MAAVIIAGAPMTGNVAQSYAPLLLHILVAMGIAGAILTGSSLIGWRRPSRAKGSPYECGVQPTGDALQPFSVKFYLVAMVFILFDVEAVFLYPWAFVYRELRWFGFFEMLHLYRHPAGRVRIPLEEGRAGLVAPGSAPGARPVSDPPTPRLAWHRRAAARLGCRRPGRRHRVPRRGHTGGAARASAARVHFFAVGTGPGVRLSERPFGDGPLPARAAFRGELSPALDSNAPDRAPARTRSTAATHKSSR